MQSTVFVVLCRKTACAELAGYISIALFGFGFAAFFVQLFIYIYLYKYALHAVCAALFIMYCGIIAGAVYCIMLGRNSHKGLCIVSGIFGFFPPVGTVFAIVLSYKIDRDTRMKEMVFGGYAYTYAALGAFDKYNAARLVDAAEEDDYDALKPKAAKALIKKLKKQATTPEGAYNYAVAVIRYAPGNMRDAVSKLTKAADGEFVPALFNLGYCYETGTYVKKDEKRARDYYSRAAAAGDKDAALRLCILAVNGDNAAEGVRMLSERAEGGDEIAEYDLAVCYERGLGAEKDISRAVELYYKCAKNGLFIAQKRLCALAGRSIIKLEPEDLFNTITGLDYSGTGALEHVIKGLIEVWKKQAADAAELFINAVKCRGKWEGVARCLVGTLYIDMGALSVDRRNGVDYVKSAVGMTPIAKDILASLPGRDRGRKAK